MIVRKILSSLGFHVSRIELGEADIVEQLQPGQRDRVRSELSKVGLELLEDNKETLVRMLRNIIDDLVQHSEEPLNVNLSVYLGRQLHHDYSYLANLFTEVEGLSIQKSLILRKIERVKKILIETDLSLNEIVFKMNYCSVSHLSSQFKKVTGFTPSRFREKKEEMSSKG